MASPVFTNVLSVGHSSYVTDEGILFEYLRERFGENVDFNISNFNDRWSFDLSVQLSREELEKLANEVADRCEEAWQRRQSMCHTATAAPATANRETAATGT